MNEVEPQGSLDVLQKPMAYKTDEFLANRGPATGQALEEREFAPVVFSKINEPKRFVAVGFQNDGVRGVLEEASTERDERRIFADRGELIVIFVGRNLAVDELAFEETGQESADENYWFARLAHAQRRP
jgi:hypothetical protein